MLHNLSSPHFHSFHLKMPLKVRLFRCRARPVVTLATAFLNIFSCRVYSAAALGNHYSKYSAICAQNVKSIAQYQHCSTLAFLSSIAQHQYEYCSAFNFSLVFFISHAQQCVCLGISIWSAFTQHSPNIICSPQAQYLLIILSSMQFKQP